MNKLIIILVSLIGLGLFLLFNVLQRMWVKFCIKKNFVVEEFNKIFSDVKCVLNGGIIVVILYMLYLVLTIPIFKYSMPILILCLSFFIFSLFEHIGGWKGGIPQKIKFFIPFIFGIIPGLFIHKTEIWLILFNIPIIPILYSLIFVPIAVLGASQGFNMLAGFNGESASLSLCILLMLSLMNPSILPYTIPLIFLILAFYMFNKYPARVFPGDTFTYVIGALIGYFTCIVGSEILCVIFFAPFFVELIIKLLNFLKVEGYTINKGDGTLMAEFPTTLYRYFYHHGYKTERAIVLGVLYVEIILCVISLAIYYIFH